ncbi:hypothetical protein A2U01_0068743, partial [Trifolium medium]|nr:hypothetical protein [Trifolium medium]
MEAKLKKQEFLLLKDLEIEVGVVTDAQCWESFKSRAETMEKQSKLQFWELGARARINEEWDLEFRRLAQR